MPAPDSLRSMRVRARFGLPACGRDRAHADRLALLEDSAGELHSRLGPGRIALVTGPSGSGKSLALRAFAALSGARQVTPISRRAKRAPVEMIAGDLDAALGLLGAAGLGEARRLVTPAGLLSDGERARLALARTIALSRGGDLVCDEFTSPLDRLTARSVCRCVRRALAPGQRLVCATAHDDVAPMLDPDPVLLVPLVGPPELLERGGAHGDAGDRSVA